MEFRDAVYRVVRSLRLFELGYTSAKRTPVDYQIRVRSLSEYIEVRLNFELFKHDKLRAYEEMTDGHLFVVDQVFDESGRWYSKVVVSLCEKPDELSLDDYESLTKIVTDLVGGLSVSFSSNKNKLNIQIEG